MRLKKYPYITYEDLQKRDPIKYFSKSNGLPEDYIKEIYRICETDFRFSSARFKYIQYEEISRYIKKIWRINLTKRQIKYIHNVLRSHYNLMAKLKKGGKMFGTYRSLVLRKG